MVDYCFEGYAAGVRYESPGWLQAHDTAVRGREADRAALVCANCEVDGSGGQETC